MANQRDEFRDSTKRKLGNRVAWTCSFPGCCDATIGPGSESPEQVIRLGDAAHIHAASKDGPRFDPKMSSVERRSIDNGIWMCQRHARFIDADYTAYSPATLRAWKAEAENKAYAALGLPNRPPHNDSLTLVQLGMGIVFHGKWIAASPLEWILEVENFVYGNSYSLRDYCSQFENSHPREKFIVIQDQGDGRQIKSAPRWRIDDGKLQVTVVVEEKYIRQDPHQTGSDIALSLSGDIFTMNGDIAIVSGLDSAKQQIMNALSIRPGDLIFHPETGSLFSKYFSDHKKNEGLISSLLKLEIARLASLPDVNRETSPLGFVNRVIEATFETTEIPSDRVSVLVEIEWGNREITKDRYSIFVGHGGKDSLTGV